jgi:hypothetical protein
MWLCKFLVILRFSHSIVEMLQSRNRKIAQNKRNNTMKAIAGAIVLLAGSIYALAIALVGSDPRGEFTVIFGFVILFHIVVGFCLLAFGKDQPKG